jgi:2-dehydro-3-deoxyphosphogluconate aldolase/(4S)-4-hydroxy-2-oxoglutarate aldolase
VGFSDESVGFSDEWFEREFAGTQVMVIMRGLGAGKSLELAARAWEAGVTAVELPIQRPADIEALTAVAAAARERGLNVGAGTVIEVEQVEVAKRAGAAYTVSPGTDEEIIRASLAAGLPTLPGVGSASEVQRCLKLGLTWLKAFPASALGPGWIKAMLGPFPGVRFVVTGGVSVGNAADFLAAGARVASLGSALADPDQVDQLAKLARR